MKPHRRCLPLIALVTTVIGTVQVHAQFIQQGEKLVGTGTLSQAFQGSSVALSADGNTAIIGGPSDIPQGAAWVFTRSNGAWTQEGTKLVGDGAIGNAHQGTSVSLSADGNTAIIGGEFDNQSSGAAWVFVRSKGIWSQQGAKLVGTGATGWAQQGHSVSVSADGNTALVGGVNDSNGIGAAWVFVRDGLAWRQQGSKLVGMNKDSLSFNSQGSSVSLSADGRTALIGGNSAAWVFKLIGSQWVQQGDGLVGSGVSGYLLPGAPVSLSGDGHTAIVGGPNDGLGVGAAWVFTLIGDAWIQQGKKLVGTGAVGEAHMGHSVAVSGDGSTTVMGGVFDDNFTGATWVFTRSDGVWSQQGMKLVGAGASGNPSQGGAVSISSDGNTALVGGHFDSLRVGAAWVFTRSGGVWSQQGTKLVGSGAVGSAGQGESVSLSFDGNTAIVGGYSADWQDGAAWIFTRSGGKWTQQGNKLVGADVWAGSNQGRSVSLSSDGHTAIVGGPGDEYGTGAACVFIRSDSVWSQQGEKLVGTGAVGQAYQGTSVCLSSDGNTAVMGGWADNEGVGAAWVFARTAGVWHQQGGKLVGTGGVGIAQQGSAVALSGDGNTAIIGGVIDNNPVGAAWVFTRSAGVWNQQGEKLVGTGAVGSPSQGCSVSLSEDGNTAVVGGYGDDGYKGAAWVFVRSGGVWSQQGGKLVGTGASGSSYQGISVSISDDGNTIIVGGREDSGRVGAVWAFKRTGEAWVQCGSKLVGTGAEGCAWQGNAVSISGDGNTALVGGPLDNLTVGAVWAFARDLSWAEGEGQGAFREFKLGQNYPNPFNPTTTIRYGLPTRSHVTLSVYNLLGQIVRKLVDEVQPAGSYEVPFDGTPLASGIYICRLRAGSFTAVRAMVLMK